MPEKKALRYNQGKSDWTLLDFPSIEEVVRVMSYGATKYERDNWKRPCDDPKQHIQSALRHLIALAGGEEFDKESHLRHSGHIIANMMMYNFHVKLSNETQTIGNNDIPIYDGTDLEDEFLK